MKRIINCTPHAINIVGIADFAPSGTVPRVQQTTEQVDAIGEIPVVEMKFGEVYDLPPVTEDTVYIVSRMVLSACTERSDLLCPGELVRNEEGNIIGCKNLCR